MKKVKVSPPKAGGLYPEVYESSTISSTDSRPDSVQEDRGSRVGDYTVDTLNSSYESTVTVNSDAPSLGMEIVALAGSRKTVPNSNTSFLLFPPLKFVLFYCLNIFSLHVFYQNFPFPLINLCFSLE